MTDYIKILAFEETDFLIKSFKNTFIYLPTSAFVAFKNFLSQLFTTTAFS